MIHPCVGLRKMTSKDKYYLPSWKKIKLNLNRELPNQALENQLSVLTLELKDPESRELVVRLRTDADHEANMKVLNSVDVPRVKSVLEDLGGNPDGLTKEGVCLAILVEIQRRLPHKCSDCNSMVNYNPSVPVATFCVGCGTQLCERCYQGNFRNVVCKPCSYWVKERFTIPVELFRKNHKKEAETPVQHSETDSSKVSETLNESMQCGQPRAESTIVGLGPHRGGSLLMDSTVLEKTIIPQTQSSPQPRNHGGATSLSNTVRDPAQVSSRTQGSSKGDSKGDTKGDTKEKCRYFLKGQCRHGFSGKLERDGKTECLFLHPPVCKKYMDQGPKGCSKGTGCDYTHVTVCPESLEKKTCGNSQEGKRCKSGYHLKGTKSVKLNSDTPPQ